MLKRNIHQVVKRVIKKWNKPLKENKRNNLIHLINKINKKELGYSILIDSKTKALIIKKIKQEQDCYP
jgi:uncharacterized protein YpuA (DUF1002 family)